MTLVFAGMCIHGPGITARPEAADPATYARLVGGYARQRKALEAARPDALVMIAAEHFANFFMNNMRAYAMRMADHYEGPIEEPEWLKIPRTRVPGDVDLSRRLIQVVMQDIDVSYCEEWKFDHGISEPLHFLTPRYDLRVVPINVNCQGPPLTPLHRTWAFGEALRRACDAKP